MINKLKKDLQKLKNPQKAEHLQRFFKTGKGEYAEGDVFLGLTSPQIKELVKKYKDLSLDNCEILLQNKIHEFRVCSLKILIKKFTSKKTSEEEKKQIFNLYIKNTKYINNWDLIDISAPYIISGYLKDKNKKILYDFAKSSDLWKKRISIIGTFGLIRENNFQDALNISEILLNDKHDLIHKAVGWMLREIGKRNLEKEEKFLKMYYKKMPRTMLRYAIEKFPELKRKKYLKGEI